MRVHRKYVRMFLNHILYGFLEEQCEWRNGTSVVNVLKQISKLFLVKKNAYKLGNHYSIYSLKFWKCKK